MNKAKRIKWVDIAKGIGIIAVVIGHAYPKRDIFYQSLYWWHMPLFFMIGGFFLKPIQNWSKYWVKKVWPLLHNYFKYGLILICISTLVSHQTWNYFIDYLKDLFYGGTHLNHTTSAFWFITVYILATLIVLLTISFVHATSVQIALMVSFFFIGNSYPNMAVLIGKSLPWDADVSLTAAFYMYAGYFLIHRVPARFLNSFILFISIILISTYLVYLQATTKLNFLLYMKSHHLTQPLLGFTVPILISFAIFMIANWIKWTPLESSLSFLGRHTIPIMYLHKLCFQIFDALEITQWQVQVMGGIIFPLLIFWTVLLIKHWFNYRHQNFVELAYNGLYTI